MTDQITEHAIMMSRCIGYSFWWLKSKGGSHPKVVARCVVAYLLLHHCPYPVSFRRLSALFGKSEFAGRYYYRRAFQLMKISDPDFVSLYQKGKDNFINPDKSHLPEFVDTTRYQRT